jgi:VWFA-related protein
MRTRNRLSLAIVTFAVCSLVPVNQAQQTPATPAPAPKGPAHDVVLPVTARDKKGALVPGLQQGDFTLTDEGRPQTIKSLTHDTSLPFRLGLLVDTGRNLSAAIEGARKGANAFVDQMLPAQGSEGKDQAFLIHFDREVELLEDFTNSREKLHHELEQMGPTRRSQTEGPETTGENRGEAHGGRGGAQMYDAIFLAADELMKPKDGHKAMVLFSNGVDKGSKETLNEAVDSADRAGVAIYTIYYKGEQERGENQSGIPGGGRRGGGYPGGGGGYPGGGGGYPGGGGGYPNGGGGRRGGGSTESGVDGRKIMQLIATRTGGHAYEAKKKDDLEEIYRLIAEELRGQYLLTYTPDKPDNDGSFHKVALKANKSDLTVVTREGYFAPGGEEAR